MRLLALDTATDCCSVALWHDGAVLCREARAERGHGGHVLALVDELLAEAGVSLGALDAIAFGRGPGAFTGVRLAASVTQGLAYAAGLPVIPVSDLQAVAQRTLARQAAAPHAAVLHAAVPHATAAPAFARVLVCHDARMGEVYWAGFDAAEGHARAATAEAVARPAPLIEAALAWLDAVAGGPQGGSGACGAGTGFAVHAELAAGLVPRLEPVWPDLTPHAREIAVLAAHEGLGRAVPPDQAQPVYIRNDVAIIPAPAAPLLS